MKIESLEYKKLCDSLVSIAPQLALDKIIGHENGLSWNLLFQDAVDILIELDTNKNSIVLSISISEIQQSNKMEICLMALKYNALWRQNDSAYLGVEGDCNLTLYMTINFINRTASDLLTDIKHFLEASEMWKDVVAAFHSVQNFSSNVDVSPEKLTGLLAK